MHYITYYMMFTKVLAERGEKDFVHKEKNTQGHRVSYQMYAEGFIAVERVYTEKTDYKNNLELIKS